MFFSPKMDLKIGDLGSNGCYLGSKKDRNIGFKEKRHYIRP
jgi:hypothetical protein